MYRRPSLLAFSLLAAAVFMALPARAESRYATSRFEITFGDGWQDLPSPAAGDSAVTLMYGYSMMGFCYMTASVADHPITARDFDDFRKQYAGADSVLKVAEGSDTLGGRDFAYTEYKNADSSNGDIRIRIYSASNGTLRFNSVLAYDFSNGATLVTEMDSALATLTFSPASIPSWAPRPPTARVAADQDVLGRSLIFPARTVLFRLPSR